ncbi:hypothetical protein D9757_003003 [Collybiopsis confluens]|uniref:Tetraspanin n=1 Tax=Collybiopsis confluens TaxID=2823264 RepID=A0A8H5ME68_9AGAR|nr:hypothetical protein D9757_003003 [Collybiopsis confluens]
MSPSRAKRFCGLFSPALGVITLSCVWIISGFAIAISGWLQVHQLLTYPIPSPYYAALYCHAILFTVLGVAGIYGITAVSSKRHSFISGYLILLGIHLLLSFGGGIFFLVMVHRIRTSDEIKACLGRVSNNDLTATQRCYTPIALHQNAAIAIYVLTWIFELYTCVMVFSCLGDSKQANDSYSDLEKNTVRNGLVKPLSISDPKPIPNFKPATMSMMMGNNGVPISAIHDVVTPGVQGFAGGVQQHSWETISTPRRASRSSPPITPITPSRPDFVSGIKPLLLTKKPATQPNSPHVIPPLEISTSPIHPYGLGSAGLSTSYAFSAPINSYGSISDQVTPTQAAFTDISNRI